MFTKKQIFRQIFMIAVMTLFVSCSKEEPLTTTEVQKTKNISSKVGFTPKGKLIIENNSNFVFDFQLVVSGGSNGPVSNNNSNSQNNTFINPNIDLWQMQVIDGITVTTYNSFITSTSNNPNWDLSIDNAQPTPITNIEADDKYKMPIGSGNYYIAWGGLRGKLIGTITDPDNQSYSETLNTRTSCNVGEFSIFYGNFGWEFPEIYFSVNFVNYTKLKLVFTAEVLANGDTVLNIKQILY